MSSFKAISATTSMSLCSSQFAASPACVPRDVSSRIGIPRPSCANSLPAIGSFGVSERYGRASSSSERRLMVVRATKGKKRPTLVDKWTRASTTTSPDAAPDAAPGAAGGLCFSFPSRLRLGCTMTGFLNILVSCFWSLGARIAMWGEES